MVAMLVAALNNRLLSQTVSSKVSCAGEAGSPAAVSLGWGLQGGMGMREQW